MGFLAVITLGFLAGLFFTGLSIQEMATGIIPVSKAPQPSCWRPPCWAPPSCRTRSTFILGWCGIGSFVWIPTPPRRHLTATRWDVAIALVVAGSVNIGMLCLAAEALQGVEGTDSIEGAHRAVTDALGLWWVRCSGWGCWLPG